MKTPKLIEINLDAAKQLVRMLDKTQEITCTGCTGDSHEASCPAKAAEQLRNYLTQRINNPNKHFRA